ncbi:unnamed protein product [Acanthoscelides obtectus]|uniref:Uncharacterized protein n=1 Tax=Acanthoscelides obtectus TaxID=200917 RepID=A0A9P0KKC9_ACAOB|nr:unnamed protein product [Acanthoscelides obtectus]CAK1664827.1 hypothetical protein AOBTE_LOCUS24491 [Acanthoscelides obtectus]
MKIELLAIEERYAIVSFEEVCINPCISLETEASSSSFWIMYSSVIPASPLLSESQLFSNFNSSTASHFIQGFLGTHLSETVSATPVLEHRLYSSLINVRVI